MSLSFITFEGHSFLIYLFNDAIHCLLHYGVDFFFRFPPFVWPNTNNFPWNHSGIFTHTQSAWISCGSYSAYWLTYLLGGLHQFPWDFQYIPSKDFTERHILLHLSWYLHICKISYFIFDKVCSLVIHILSWRYPIYKIVW